MEDPFPAVACPTCQADVRVTLPRSNDIVSVTGGGDCDRSPRSELRRRRAPAVCSEGHALCVAYDW